jgi:hypothetical protein
MVARLALLAFLMLLCGPVAAMVLAASLVCLAIADRGLYRRS